MDTNSKEISGSLKGSDLEKLIGTCNRRIDVNSSKIDVIYGRESVLAKRIGELDQHIRHEIYQVKRDVYDSETRINKKHFRSMFVLALLGFGFAAALIFKGA